MYLPSLDRFDLAAFLCSLGLLVVGYVLFPPHPIVRLVVWLSIFVISVAWMAFFLWKWFFDMEI